MPMIEVRDLTKRYGDKLAVDNLSFEVAESAVTGFLGPNGAGKSTTMRVILGLDSADEGAALIDGRHYLDIERPLTEVGALLEAKAFHPGRSPRNHLIALAQSNGLSPQRVDGVLEMVGLSDVADKRVKGFSLGMNQRLGIAVALLGDPRILLFDEPTNGLDPEGIRWVRSLCRSLAAEGRSVLVSSHLMSEVALMADHLVVLGRGRLVAQTTTVDFLARSSGHFVRVRSPRLADVAALLRAHDAGVTFDVDGSMAVTGMEAAGIAELAASQQLVLHELAPQSASLEDAFMELTESDVEFRAGNAMERKASA
jgi:ABC-2 type transport system ATP-binding protein